MATPRLEPPRELKFDVLKYLHPIDVQSYAQTSDANWRTVRGLRIHQQLQRLSCNSLCIKTCKTSRIYIECVVHDDNERHSKVDLVARNCHRCLGKCAHYEQSFVDEHLEQYPTCRMIF